jgi:uncharacterized membrane protein YfcA
VIAVLVVLVSAIIMGLTGFGFALIFIPVFILFMEAKTVIILNIILGTLLCIPIMWQTRKHLIFSKIALLVISSIIGLPVGIYILAHVAPPIMKLIIGSAVVIFAILLGFGFSYKIKKEWLGCIVSGFICGVLMTSIGLGGLPVIIFLLNQGWERNVFRSNLNAFFILSGIAAFIALGAAGTMTMTTLTTALILIPPLAIGLFIGLKLLPRVNTIWNKRISTLVLIAVGLLGVADALTVLL